MNHKTDIISRQTNAPAMAGFTLVELLVVIGIIGMLMAMLLPAVMSGQEQARQTQCQKQMKDLAGANLAHAMKKGRFPGWKESATESWVVRILPYLDMQEMSRLGKNDPGKYDQDPIFYCPSNSPEDLGDGNDSLLHLGYRANIGSGTAGIFQDRTGSSFSSVGLEDIRDGKKNTLLLSESAQVNNDQSVWASQKTDPPAWDNSGLGLGFKYIASGESSLNDVSGDDGQASSFHQEGFNVAYCDGHTDFFFWDPKDADAASNYANFQAKMTHAGSD